MVDVCFSLHQKRLLPVLAKVIVQGPAVHRLADDYDQLGLGMGARVGTKMGAEKLEEQARVHLIAAGIKAEVTWTCLESLQAAREACGGQGFKGDNRIGMPFPTSSSFTFSESCA